MQLAPATAPADRPLPGTGSAYPTTVRGPLPHLDLSVPDAVHAQLARSVERGQRDAAAWITAHPGATLEAFREFVVARVGTPPSDAAAERDLQVVRDAAAARTSDGLRDARWIDVPGLFALWNRHASTVMSTLGAADAARAARLLDSADQVSSLLTFAVKGDGHRDRPFQVDPTGASLAPGISKVHGSSWPSGHASRAWSNALVLGAIAPARAAQFAADAEQVSWGRAYAAAHFPSDVAAGAYIGAAAATWALQTGA